VQNQVPFRPPKLSTRLLLLVLAASLPGMALVAVLAFSYKREAMRMAEARAYELAALLVAAHRSELAGSIDLSSLTATMGSAPLPSGTVLTLIDSAGTVLARHPDPDAWVGRDVRDEPLARAALANGSRSARVHGLDGVERFYAFQPLPELAATDALLAVGIPMSRALTRAKQTLWRSMVALLLVLSLALVLSRITASRLILKPTEILVNAADRLRAGDLTARTGIPLHREGGRLAAAFDAMAARMEEQTAELERSRAELRLLARRTEEQVERERRRIARAVHDDLGQALTALRLDTNWLAQRLNGEDPAVREHLRAMQELLDTTSTSVRRISTELRPSVLDDLGLDAAVEWQTQDFARRTGIRSETHLHTRRAKLPDAVSIALFRILQEALTNVVRHADASRVAISLIEETDRVVLEVTDDGVGIARRADERQPSLGLLGMRERAEALGGSFTVENTSPRGTTVRAEIPLDDSAQDAADQP
jgi:signal transduction histidine kinase